MIKVTNINSLGTDYTVTDINGNILKTIQIVTPEEILDAMVGEYNNSFENMNDYLEKSVKYFTGYDKEPYTTLWWSAYDQDLDVTEIIEYAMTHRYNKIILEYLTDD